MQLVKWRNVNKRYFAKDSRFTEKQWQQMIRNGVINGRIIGSQTLIDVDQLAANVELGCASVDDTPDLLS